MNLLVTPLRSSKIICRHHAHGALSLCFTLSVPSRSGLPEGKEKAIISDFNCLRYFGHRNLPKILLAPEICRLLTPKTGSSNLRLWRHADGAELYQKSSSLSPTPSVTAPCLSRTLAFRPVDLLTDVTNHSTYPIASTIK